MTTPLPLSRRRLLKVSASTLLAASLWPGALEAADADAGEDFSFIAVNDLHCVDEKCGPYFEKAVASMKALKQKPDLCLIVGDLADGGTAQQVGLVRDLFKTLGMPIKVVVGNHDYKTDDDRKAYDELCPDSINYTFGHHGWQFIALDSTQGTSASATIQKPTLDWLDANVPKLDNKRPTILFTHFPMGPKVTNRAKNADAVLERLKGLNLRHVFGGHYHAYTETKVNDLICVTNRCCSFRRMNHDRSKEKGYWICRAAEGKVSREFVEVPV